MGAVACGLPLKYLLHPSPLFRVALFVPLDEAAIDLLLSFHPCLDRNLEILVCSEMILLPLKSDLRTPLAVPGPGNAGMTGGVILIHLSAG